MTLRTLYHCSLCGVSENEARQLIAGPHLFVCDDCVMVMFVMLGKNDPVWRARAGAELRAPDPPTIAAAERSDLVKLG